MQSLASRPTRSFSQLFPDALRVAAVVGLTTAVTGWAQEIRFAWEPSGIGKQLGSYIPQRLILKREAPQSLKKSPPDLAAPLYGEIKVGPREAQATRLVLLDEPADKPPRLF